MSTPRSEARQPIATIRADHFTVFLLGAFSVIRGDARAMFIDDNATDEQFDALVAAYGGKLGGPLADLADLVGEILDVRRAPIRHEVRDGAGTLSVGDFVSAEMAPYRAADGSTTTLRDTVFSTVPGSPAYVSKATRNTVDLPQYGLCGRSRGGTRSSPTTASRSRGRRDRDEDHGGRRGGRAGRGPRRPRLPVAIPIVAPGIVVPLIRVVHAEAKR